MTTRRKAQCSHCRAILNVDQPQVRRSGPCPSCKGQINVPDDLIKDELPVEKSEARKPLRKGNQLQPSIQNTATLVKRRDVRILLGCAAGMLLLTGLAIVLGMTRRDQTLETVRELHLMAQAAQQ